MKPKNKYYRTVNVKCKKNGDEYADMSIPKPIFGIYKENGITKVVIEMNKDTKVITVTPIEV